MILPCSRNFEKEIVITRIALKMVLNYSDISVVDFLQKHQEVWIWKDNIWLREAKACVLTNPVLI